MKVGDMIRVCAEGLERPNLWIAGLLIKINSLPTGRRVGTVLTNRGIETWPLDAHYEYEVISESW